MRQHFSFTNVLKIILEVIRKFRFRHLRLGPKKLFGLLLWRLNPLKSVQSASQDRGWIQSSTTITILLTVHNQSKADLLKAITSVRNQNGTSITVIILDDGSTNPETKDFLDYLELNENEHLFREKNVGVVAARNFLINKTFTDFLIFLDPDDSLCDDLVSRVVEVLDRYRDIEILFTNVLVHDVAKDKFDVWETGPFELDTLAKVNTIPMSSFVSTRLIKGLNGFSSDFQSGFEDWDLWYRAALSGARAGHLPIIGYRYTKAPISRTTIMKDNADLITLRASMAKANFPFHLKNKVEIFVLIPFLPRIGGVENYTKVLIEDLKNAGYEVILIVTETNPQMYIDDVENYRKSGTSTIRRLDFPDDDLFRLAIETLAAPNTLSINLGSPWVFSKISDFNGLFDRNVCFIFNDEVSAERGLKNKDYFDEFWLAYDSLKRLFESDDMNRLQTIYTGVIEGSRAKKKKQDNFLTVGFLGRYSPEKNPLLFLAIAKSVAAKGNIKFIMGGEGPLNHQVEEKVRRLSNTRNFGYISDGKDFLDQIDLLLVTSDVEGIPLVAMEALSMGIPVVSKNVGGISELLEDGKNGMIWDGTILEITTILESETNTEKSVFHASLNQKFWRSSTSRDAISRIRILLDSDTKNSN